MIALLGAGLPAIGLAQQAAPEGAGRALESIDVHPLAGRRVELQLHLNALAPKPMSFTIDNPARIALDLPGTSLALDSRRKDVNQGALTSILSAEANGRTRIVLNLSSMVPYSTRVAGDIVYVDLGEGENAPASSADPFTAQPAAQQTAAAGAARAIDNIDFRRGPDGAGRVIVDLSNPQTSVNVHEEGGRILVDFADTALPDRLMKRLDVTDFATPVATIDALRTDGSTRLIVTPNGEYDQIAYQSDNVFTLELKEPAKQQQAAGAGLFDENKQYTGQRLTLNFQDIETRAVLQLLADTSGLNIVVSDSVRGNVTLRLQNVPWDQALDILLATKGLGMRRNGNVILVAPAEEIAAREQAQLKAAQALKGLEPLRSEFIQVNYAKASDLATLIKGAGTMNRLISDRGSVAVDQRTNTLLVQDTADRLTDIRRLVATLDIPVRQVLIEARIVVVNDDFSKDLGVRFGSTIVKQNGKNGLVSLTGTSKGSDTIVGSALNNLASTGSPFPVSLGDAPSRYSVNLPAAAASGAPGSLALAILKSDTLLDLELSAIQAEGKGRIVSTPHIVTANQKEAKISQGVEIPYQQSASSGATTTQFKDAVLSLTVTPQITPDDRIIMDLSVTKDSVGQDVSSATGGSVPSIDTRSVETQVLVSDGETVVLGGIYETENRETINKVPLLGDIPGLGHLFRSRGTVNNKDQLLIFVTPKILRQGASTAAAAVQ
ncbi:MAG TPA: type IV pilus secretin PilQ [Gammaproteobacteria bacterium]|nr:type IV pilus secretin PilQ [Gammaproteobacteria bacterium]